MASVKMIALFMLAAVVTAEKVSVPNDETALLQNKVEVRSHLGGGEEAPAVKQGEDAGFWAEVTHPTTARAAYAEFIAMTLFVFIGCGSAAAVAKEEGSAWKLQVSLTFGIAITVLAYSIGHISGAHINCAVTFGLFVANQITAGKAFAYLGAQLLGSILGASLVWIVFGRGNDRTGSLGCNKVREEYSYLAAFVGEAMGTFILVFVVLETAVDNGTKENRLLAAVAIGFAVFLAHSVLISMDGCSINPTRSTGPALTAMLVPCLDKLMAATNDAAANLQDAADKAKAAADSAATAAANPADLASKDPGSAGGLAAGAGAPEVPKVPKIDAQEKKEEMERRAKELKEEFCAIMYDLMFFWIGPLFGAFMAAETWESLKA